jgi:hypothetical protein
MSAGEERPGFPRRLARLLRAEAARLRGRWGPPAAVAAVAGAAALGALAYRFLAPMEDPDALRNGWGCAAQAARAGLPVAAFAALLLGSQVVAGEAAAGTLRSVLCTPFRRLDVFAAKALAALAWGAVLFAAAWGAALALGAALYGFGDVTETLRYGGKEYLHVHRTAAAMQAVLARAVPLSLPPLAAASLLGFACSVLARRPAAAMGAAAGTYLVLEVFLKNFGGAVSRYLFATYTGRFAEVLGQFAAGLNTARLNPADVRLSLAASAAAGALLLAVSLAAFLARDLE